LGTNTRCEAAAFHYRWADPRDSLTNNYLLQAVLALPVSSRSKRSAAASIATPGSIGAMTSRLLSSSISTLWAAAVNADRLHSHAEARERRIPYDDVPLKRPQCARQQSCWASWQSSIDPPECLGKHQVSRDKRKSSNTDDVTCCILPIEISISTA
jgi:hypothetical protein